MSACSDDPAAAKALSIYWSLLSLEEMTLEQRHRISLAVELSRAGCKLRQIGEMLGRADLSGGKVSPERARQLRNRGLRFARNALARPYLLRDAAVCADEIDRHARKAGS